MGLPTGITKVDKKFRVRLSRDGTHISIGTFNTRKAAVQALGRALAERHEHDAMQYQKTPIGKPTMAQNKVSWWRVQIEKAKTKVRKAKS